MNHQRDLRLNGTACPDTGTDKSCNIVILEAGVNVTMIQVGNEVTNGLLWPEGLKPNYDNIARFISSGKSSVNS